MCKTRNTGTGTDCENAGMGACFIPENVANHSAKCPQTFRGMFSNNPENIRKINLHNSS